MVSWRQAWETAGRQRRQISHLRQPIRKRQAGRECRAVREVGAEPAFPPSATRVVANDPEKSDLTSPRGTLDHSIMFAIAKTLESGEWHHERSYGGIENNRSLAELIRKIETTFDESWEDRYHSTDPKVQAFGGKMIVTFRDGSRLEAEKAVANAHVYGASPWGRPEYLEKFRELTNGKISPTEQGRLIADVENLGALTGSGLCGLTVKLDLEKLHEAPSRGIYGGGQ